MKSEESYQIFKKIMSGDAASQFIKNFLLELAERGETKDDIIGAVKALLETANPFPIYAGAVDTCGTGGDKKGTYNISTAVAFVVAGGGVPVIKHGNKAVSSKSGSADVLAELGVDINMSPEQAEKCLKHAGVTFLLAPIYHPAMRHVAPIRQELGCRTIFNLLGPLLNPAKVSRQIIGVYDKKWLVPLAQVCHELGKEHVMIVHGNDGLDEITTCDITQVAELKNGEITEYEINPKDYDLFCSQPDELVGGDAVHNAKKLRELLNGEDSQYRNIVLLNSAAAIYVSGKADDLNSAINCAKESIDSGKALDALEKLSGRI